MAVNSCTLAYHVLHDGSSYSGFLIPLSVGSHTHWRLASVTDSAPLHFREMTTENDRSVLDSIFSPLIPTCNLTAQPEQWTTQEAEDEFKASSAVEIEGVKAAEDGATDRAIALFSTAISLAPNRASCHNNRAQAYSLKGDLNRAMEDLDKAVSLCPNDQPQKVASFVYTQRGIIHQARGNMPAALKEYEKGAKLGNAFAKQQVVANNDMAKKCNEMFSQAFAKLQKPAY